MELIVKNRKTIVRCDESDQEVKIISKNNNSSKINQLIIAGIKTRNVKRVFIDQSICLNLQKISIQNTSIDNLWFLKILDLPNLNELVLKNNSIKTNKREILEITSKLPKIKKVDLSNFFCPVKNDLNCIEDFYSEKYLPEFISVKNCQPCKVSSPFEQLETIEKAFLEILEKRELLEELNSVETSLKDSFLYIILFLQSLIILAMTIMKIKKKDKTKS